MNWANMVNHIIFSLWVPIPESARRGSKGTGAGRHSTQDHPTRILEKQNTLQMSQVFPFACIGDQMGLAFQGFYKRDRGSGKVTKFPRQLNVYAQIKEQTLSAAREDWTGF